MKSLLILLAIGSMAIAGCGSKSYLDSRTEPGRADYGDQTLPAPPADALPRVNMNSPNPARNSVPEVQEVITGTWTFTVPPTVTRVERQTRDYSQFSLYMGRPAPSDTPFVVITVSDDPRSIAESDAAAYHIANQRDYTLNGNTAREWTGNKATGEGFCELLVSKPGGKGQVCHAMAVAKTDEQRKLSLDILASITWTASGGM